MRFLTGALQLVQVSWPIAEREPMIGSPVERRSTMNKSFATAALAFAAPGMFAMSMPAMAAPTNHTVAPAGVTGAVSAHAQDRWDRSDRSDRSYGHNDGSGYRDDRISRDTRVWRDDDGHTRCRRADGTTGLLIGGAAGGVLGNSIAGRGDRTLGTILGIAGGALLGREIDRSNSRCR
jgi:hypothetical protein